MCELTEKENEIWENLELLLGSLELTCLEILFVFRF